MKFKREDLEEALSFLEEAYIEGYQFISYPRDRALYRGDEIFAFFRERDAAEHAAINGDWYSEKLLPFLNNMRQVSAAKNLPEVVETGHYYYLPIEKTMNRNNLEQLKETLKSHGFGEHLIKQMEENMEKSLPAFKLQDIRHTDKGQIDISLNFRQSAKSDYYYFNSYKLELSKAKPLENGYQYSVIDRTNSGVKYFDSPVQAMELFRAKKGDAELALGKNEDGKHVEGATIASMKGGKVDYVAKEFYGLYRTPVAANTFYLKNDSTFTLEQGANLMQGRAVFRDDLLNRSNEQYSAWVQLDFDQAKDNYGNYKMRTYSEGYGFDLKKELQSYPIKELADEKKMKAIMVELKAGGKPFVTIEGREGDNKLQVTAMPRYNNLNFYEQNGKPVIREELKKGEQLDQVIGKGKSREKSKGTDQEHEMSM